MAADAGSPSFDRSDQQGTQIQAGVAAADGQRGTGSSSHLVLHDLREEASMGA